MLLNQKCGYLEEVNADLNHRLEALDREDLRQHAALEKQVPLPPQRFDKTRKRHDKTHILDNMILADVVFQVLNFWLA